MVFEEFGHKRIAVIQLETAIRLYNEGDEYVSAITLAGAAEEILGNLLNERGDNSKLDDLKADGVKVYKALFGSETEPKYIADAANKYRNAMKHLTTTDDHTIVFDPEESAFDMIDRAISNYWRLEENLTPPMDSFSRKSDTQ